MDMAYKISDLSLQVFILIRLKFKSFLVILLNR